MADKDYHDITREISAGAKILRKEIPDVMAGFSAMASAAGRDGALDKKTKELMALAIAIAIHCDGCIGFHTDALIKLGVTRAEFEETLGMAIYMGGGPALMYSANAMAAWDQLGGAPD